MTNYDIIVLGDVLQGTRRRVELTQTVPPPFFVAAEMKKEGGDPPQLRGAGEPQSGEEKSKRTKSIAPPARA